MRVPGFHLLDPENKARLLNSHLLRQQESTCVEMLANGADPSYLLPDGVTPFHICVGVEDAAMALRLTSIMLKLQADPNIQSPDGYTPLHVACALGRCEIVRVLLENCADPYITDQDGMNSLDNAIESGCSLCVTLLENFMFAMKEGFKSKKSLDSTYTVETSIWTDDHPQDTSKMSGSENDPLDLTVSQLASTFDLTENLSDLTIAESADHMNEAEVDLKMPSDLSLLTSDRSESQLNEYAPEPSTMKLEPQMPSDMSIMSLSETQITEKTIEPSKRSSLHKVLTDKVKTWLGFDLTEVSDVTSVCSQHSQQTVHTDDDGFKVIETRTVPDLNASFESCVSTQSTLKDWKESGAYKCSEDEQQATLPSLNESTLDNQALRQALEELGAQPGPITIATRKIYVNQLHRLQANPVATHNDGNIFPSDVYRVISGVLDLSTDSLKDAEQLMLAPFQNPDPDQFWREGCNKSCFNYLLLDPRVTQNLPARSRSLDELTAFKIFLKSVFYIGKGSRSRPYAHFKEAVKLPAGKKPSTKVAQIREIWQENLGVISLHIFQNVIACEAYTREACMIEALGLQRLTNQCKGQKYGAAASFSQSQTRHLGLRLLKKAFNIMLYEGERQIRPHDLRM